MDFAHHLPPAETHIRDIVMSKKSPSGVFVPRRVVTTESHIYLCPVSTSRVTILRGPD